MERLRSFASLLAVLVFASPALAGIGAEQRIPVKPGSGFSQFVSAAAFDGMHYLVLYTDDDRLRVQRVSEDGKIVEGPFELDDSENTFNVNIACAADGFSLAVWVTQQSWAAGPVLHAAVIPPQGAASPSFTVARSPSSFTPPAAVVIGDSFLVAWADNEGTYVSRINRLTSSITSSQKIADGVGYPEQFATAGSDVVLVWDDIEWVPWCAIPEGCPYAVRYLRPLTTEGQPTGRPEVWPQESSEALDSAAVDLYIVQPDTILRRTAGVWQRWRVRNATSLAKTSASLYASVARRVDDPLEQYVGPVGGNGHVADEYRFPASNPYLIEGRTSILALYYSVYAVTYRPIDLTTPFPTLPLGPPGISATLARSSKPYPNPWFQVNVQWTPAPSRVDRYVVEAEPLSDPTGRAYLVSVDSTVTSAVFDQLQADVEYAFRVYGSTANGLSLPAEADLRSPADLTVRPPIDVTVSVDGTTATFRWRDVSSNETGFRVKAFGPKTFTVAELPADTTTVSIRLLPGTYWYEVSAFNGTDGSEFNPGYWLSAPVRIRATRH